MAGFFLPLQLSPPILLGSTLVLRWCFEVLRLCFEVLRWCFEVQRWRLMLLWLRMLVWPQTLLWPGNSAISGRAALAAISGGAWRREASFRLALGNRRLGYGSRDPCSSFRDKNRRCVFGCEMFRWRCQMLPWPLQLRGMWLCLGSLSALLRPFEAFLR